MLLAYINDGADYLVGESKLEATFPLQPPENTQKVLVSLWRRHGFSLLDDALDDPVHVPLAPSRVPHGGAEPAHQPRGWIQVRQVEPAADKPHHFVQLAHVFVSVPAPVADDRARGDVVYHAADPVGEVDWPAAAAAALPGDGADEVRHLVLPDAPEREHAPVAEDLEHAQLAELAPLRVVGGAEDVVAAAGDGLEGGAQVAVAEGEVVGPHHLPGSLRGGDHQRGQFPEAEHHEGPVGAGHLAQRPVREVAEARQEEVVQAADQRQLPWPWRQAKR